MDIDNTVGGVAIESTQLLADDFTFKTRLPNGVEIELNALAAEEMCVKLESFGDDCSDGCKRMRADIRKAINICTANAALTNWLDGSRRSLLAARHVGEAALIRRARCATGGQGSERSERRNPARAARRIAPGQPRLAQTTKEDDHVQDH